MSEAIILLQLLLASFALSELFWVDWAGHWLVPVIIFNRACGFGFFWHTIHPPVCLNVYQLLSILPKHNWFVNSVWHTF